MDWIGSLNSWLASQLSGAELNWQSGATLALGGAVAALLPCVYPLYPITASILRERGGAGAGAWRHPAAYYLGLISVYALFGVIAGLSGGAFNQVLRLPAVNLAIAVLIFMLGLSSMELIHLPIFRGFDGARAPAGLKGSFLFGAGAGLLSSPCVGPVVVTVLIGLASGAGELSAGSVALAAARMALFGAGVGLPLMLVGVFGLRLPRSGAWMRLIQFALGLLVIYFAGVYYLKATAGWGLSDLLAIAVLGIALAALAVIAFFQRRDLPLHLRVTRSLPYAGVLLAASLALTMWIWPSPARVAQQYIAPEVHGELLWHRDRNEAFEQAQQKQRRVFVDFFAEWCTNCHEFQNLTQRDRRLNLALQQATLYKVDDRDPIFAEFQADERFPELLIGLPFFAIFEADGRLVYKTTDYLATEEMIRNLAPPAP